MKSIKVENSWVVDEKLILKLEDGSFRIGNGFVEISKKEVNKLMSGICNAENYEFLKSQWEVSFPIAIK